MHTCTHVYIRACYAVHISWWQINKCNLRSFLISNITYLSDWQRWNREYRSLVATSRDRLAHRWLINSIEKILNIKTREFSTSRGTAAKKERRGERSDHTPTHRTPAYRERWILSPLPTMILTVVVLVVVVLLCNYLIIYFPTDLSFSGGGSGPLDIFQFVIIISSRRWGRDAILLFLCNATTFTKIYI